ncbi:MAG: Spo0B domain-containing protein [Bacillota bacterium]
MQTEEALRVLRAQYHDFLNCLQIISGLLELGRPEKVKDYVRRVADEFKARGNVVKIGIPPVAWALLRLQAEGVSAGVRVAYAVERARDEVEVREGESSQAAAGPAGRWETGLNKLHRAIIAQASGSGKERLLEITGKNVTEGYVLTYSGDFVWDDIVEATKESIAASGIGLTLSGEKKVEVLLDRVNRGQACSTIT